MKLIIDISEEIYKLIDTIQNGSIGAKQIINSVKNGIPAYKAIPSAEPKRVLYIGDGYYNGEMVYDMAECPSCGEKYEDDEPAWKYAKFCMKCGQAISWEMEWEAEGGEE